MAIGMATWWPGGWAAHHSVRAQSTCSMTSDFEPGGPFLAGFGGEPSRRVARRGPARSRVTPMSRSVRTPSSPGANCAEVVTSNGRSVRPAAARSAFTNCQLLSELVDAPAADLDPTVSEASGPSERRARGTADLDGDAGLLDGLGLEDDRTEVEVLVVYLDHVLGPEATERVDDGVGAPAAALEVEAQILELVGQPPNPDPQGDPPLDTRSTVTTLRAVCSGWRSGRM